MDGVLIDAREWHYEALNRALALLGYEITRYEHLTTYDGLPTARKLQMLTVERGLPAELHAFMNSLKQQYTLELVATRCKPVFHHQYALARLKAAGYRLGVASNSVRRTVEEMMERSDLLRYLDVLISNEDVTRPKPDPEMYVSAHGAPRGAARGNGHRRGQRERREGGARAPAPTCWSSRDRTT